MQCVSIIFLFYPHQPALLLWLICTDESILLVIVYSDEGVTFLRIKVMDAYSQF